jgi:hypothetical protein
MFIELQDRKIVGSRQAAVGSQQLAVGSWQSKVEDNYVFASSRKD